MSIENNNNNKKNSKDRTQGTLGLFMMLKDPI